MRPEQVDVVLVRPARPRNVAAAGMARQISWAGAEIVGRHDRETPGLGS